MLLPVSADYSAVCRDCFACTDILIENADSHCVEIQGLLMPSLQHQQCLVVLYELSASLHGKHEFSKILKLDLKLQCDEFEDSLTL